MQTREQPAPSVLKLLAHDLRWALLQQLTRSDYRVAELVAQVKQPLNLVSYHLRQLRQAGLVHERRSTADERSFYFSLDLQRLHGLYLEASSSLHPSLGEAIPQGAARNGTLTVPHRVFCFSVRATAPALRWPRRSSVT